MNKEIELKSFVESSPEQPEKDQQNFEHLEALVRIADNIFDAVTRDPDLDSETRLKLVEIFAATELDMKLEQRKILDKYKNELTELTKLGRQKLSEESFIVKKEDVVTLAQSSAKNLVAQVNTSPHEVLPVNEVPVIESTQKRNIIFNQIAGNRFLRLATLFLMLSTTSAIKSQKLFAQEVGQKEPETKQTPESQMESKIKTPSLDSKIEAGLVKEFPVEKNDKLNSSYLYFSVRDLLEIFQYTSDSEWNENAVFLRGMENTNDYSDDPRIIAKLNELEKFYEQNNYFTAYWEWWSESRKNEYLSNKFTQSQLLPETLTRKPYNNRYVIISNPCMNDKAPNVILTFTILDLKNKTIKAQIRVPFDPQKFEDYKDCTPEQINTYILNQIVAQIKNDKNIENLNNVAVLANDCKISVDQKKYDLLTEGERGNLEKGANLIQNINLGICVLSGGIYYNFNLDLGVNQLKQPIKIDGKLYGLKFSLPRGYSVEINSRLQSSYNDSGQKNVQKFELGQDHNVGGSVDAVSQDQIVDLVIKNEKGKIAGKLSFEQMPAFYMGNISVENKANKEAYNLNFYVTDIDTLQTFQSIGREQYMKALEETAYGITQLEEYFNHNWNIRSFYVGGDIDVDNAYFNGAKNERSIFLTVRSLVVEGRALRGAKVIYRLVGRHEALHKLDWSLGPNTTNPDDHYCSEHGAFALLFKQESEDLSRLLEKVLENKDLSDDERDKIFKDHFLFLISENKFFDDPAAEGHPFSNPSEFFVSLINSLFEDPVRWEAKIKSWSPENQQKYLKSLVIVEKVLRKKGVDTSNLQKDIAKLRKIINK